MNERLYRIWDYTISHSQLLIRAEATEPALADEDLIFAGVEHFNAPVEMWNLTVRVGSAEETAVLGQGFSSPGEDGLLYVLDYQSQDGTTHSGWVVAKSYKSKVTSAQGEKSSLRRVSGDLTGAALEKEVVQALSQIR